MVSIDSIKIKIIDIVGDLAYLIDRYDSTTGGDKAFVVSLVILRKQGGKWFIVAHKAAAPDEKGATRKLNIKSSP